MILHAARAVPWLLVSVTGLLLVVLMGVVAEWPYRMWPLQGCAVGLLAGVSAWCYDEPAAAVADATPRHLRWRTAARSLGPVALLGVWTAAVLLTGDRLFGHAPDVHVQGVTAALAAVAYVAWRRMTGVASPGRRTACSVVAVFAYWGVVRPFETVVSIFPFTADGDWVASRVLWSAVALMAAAGLALSLLDLPWRSIRRASIGKVGGPSS